MGSNHDVNPDGQSSAAGYMGTFLSALSHKKVLGLAILISLIYLLIFMYFGGMLSKVQGSDFESIRDFPYLELSLNPTGYVPYLVFQPTAGWYLEINVVQAGEMVIIGVLMALIVALSGLVWRICGKTDGKSSWVAGVVPFFVSSGACAACTGIPAGLSVLPATLAGGLVAMTQFYGLPAIVTIVVMTSLMMYHLDRATRIHTQQYLLRKRSYYSGVI